jgi:hypothetical protein
MLATLPASEGCFVFGYDFAGHPASEEQECVVEAPEMDRHKILLEIQKGLLKILHCQYKSLFQVHVEFEIIVVTTLLNPVHHVPIKLVRLGLTHMPHQYMVVLLILHLLG